MIVIEPAVLLILGIVFTTLSVSERVLAKLHERGVLKKLYLKVHRKKEILEASMKENKSLLDNDDFKDILDITRNEIKNNVSDDLIDIAREAISLVSVSDFLK